MELAIIKSSLKIIMWFSIFQVDPPGFYQDLPMVTDDKTIFHYFSPG